MSLYNMINGVNPATFFILPMITDKHPEALFPRFRDCFIGELYNSNEYDQFNIPKKKVDTSKKVVSVYTRVGGGNRADYLNEISELRQMVGYIKDYDDDFDSTYATFVFSIPENFIVDYDLVLDGKLTETSKNYRERLYQVFPKLKETFDQMGLSLEN